MSVVIAVPYKCSCMKAERDVIIDARRKDEDIAALMSRVTLAIMLDHTLTSPACKETKMEYAKLPVNGGIPGGPPTNGPPGKPDILF